MKKVLVTVLALSLVTGGLFALDAGNGFSIDGRVRTGAQIKTVDDDDSDTDDTTVKAWNDDEGETTRAQLNINYAAENFGLKFRFRNNGAANQGANFRMQYGYAWADLLNKALTVSGGMFAGATEVWNNGAITGEKVIDKGAGEDDRATPAVRLEIKPLGGLSLGAMVFVPIAADTIGTNILENLLFGAKYTSDLFNLGGELKLRSDSDIEATFGAQAVAGPLLANVTGQYKSYDTSGFFAIAPKVVFKATDALSAYGLVLIAASNDDASDGAAKPDTDRTGDANYDVTETGKIIVVPFEAGAKFALNSTVGCSVGVGSNNVGYFEGNGLFVKPGVKFTLNKYANIDIWDKIDHLGGDKDKGGAFTNTLQIDVNFAF